MRQYKAKLDAYAKPGLPAVRQTLQEARELVLARADQAQQAQQRAAAEGQCSGGEAPPGNGGGCEEVAGGGEGQLPLVQEQQQQQQQQEKQHQGVENGSRNGHAAQQQGPEQAGLRGKLGQHELKRQRQV